MLSLLQASAPHHFVLLHVRQNKPGLVRYVRLTGRDNMHRWQIRDSIGPLFPLRTPHNPYPGCCFHQLRTQYSLWLKYISTHSKKKKKKKSKNQGTVNTFLCLLKKFCVALHFYGYFHLELIQCVCMKDNIFFLVIYMSIELSFQTRCWPEVNGLPDFFSSRNEFFLESAEICSSGSATMVILYIDPSLVLEKWLA